MALVYKVYKEFSILNYFCFGSLFLDIKSKSVCQTWRPKLIPMHNLC